MYHPQKEMNIMTDVQFAYSKYGIANEKYLHNDFTYSYFFVNPRIGMNYNFSDQWNSYLSLAYTSREPKLSDLYYAENSWGGSTPAFAVNSAGKYDLNNPIAKPERLLDVELGTGYKEGLNHFAANIFWMEFTDELVKNGQVDVFGQPITSNAERSRHVGLELEGSIALDELFSLSGSYSLSSNKLIKYRTYYAGGSTSFDGNPIAGFPDAIGSVRGTYRDNTFSLSAVLRYVGSFYTDNAKENKNDAYAVVNSEFTYKLPMVFNTQFTIRGEVRNVLNSLYFNSGEWVSFFPAAERNYLIGLTTSF
jgi:iron complex outermembrane recepter protein